MIKPGSWVTSVLLFSMCFGARAATFQLQSFKEIEALEADIRAAQFLSRATFGPTKTDIDALSDRIETLGIYAAFEEWIDDQFATEPTYHHSLAEQMIAYDGYPDFTTGNPSTSNYRHYAWWHAAIAAPDQLRQRMAWALSQIFVINEISAGSGSRALDYPSGSPRFLGVVDYYDMLVENAFGNYRDTLEDVTYHPVMGVFLSHRGNRKADPVKGTFPDENFAREIKQLMSIGLYQIKRNGDYVLDRNKDPIPAYDNDDIENFARVFTGLDYYGGSQNFHEPMATYESRHDKDPKTLLNGTVLPGNQKVAQDIDGALDNLFEHPNTAPFISRLLIQRFVKSNPSSRYIDAVASAFEDNGAGVRGDFEAVIKQILLNKEAVESYGFKVSRKDRTLTVEGGGTEHARLQEPVIRYAALFRAFDAFPVLTETNGTVIAPYEYFSIPNRSGVLNQEVYRSPSVFNFYRPDFRPQGELQHYRPQGRFPNKTVSAPEFQIMTSVSANTMANAFRNDIADAELDLSVRQYDVVTGTVSSPRLKIRLDFEQETLLASDPQALVRHLNILLCQGSLNDTVSNDLASIIEARTQDAPTRARGAILAMMTAPDCAVHE